MADNFDYDALNPGIRATVRWMRERGFNTTDSGDGETHEYECDRGWPFVAVKCDKLTAIAECERLYAAILERLGTDVCPEWLSCEIWYDATLGIPILEVNGISDALMGLRGLGSDGG